MIPISRDRKLRRIIVKLHSKVFSNNKINIYIIQDGIVHYYKYRTLYFILSTIHVILEDNIYDIRKNDTMFVMLKNFVYNSSTNTVKMINKQTTF